MTNDSVEALQLREGKKAFALIKATQLILGTGEAKLSTRNRLKGVVETIHEGPVNAEVNLRLAGGTLLTAMVTLNSVEELKIRAGSSVTAYCKASSVILGVSD